MPEPTKRDELDDSKMSFSEHLEELRRALFKAILALVLGSVVGFMVGTSVVDYIQTPLRAALEDFFSRQAYLAQIERLEELRDAGKPVPDDIEAAAQQMVDQRLVPTDLFFDRQELQRALDGETASPTPGAPSEFTRDDLVRLRVYEPQENDPRLNVVGLNPQEVFFVFMKASIVVGAVVASPFIFYFVWDFIAAGLYRHERKYVYIYLPISIGLFLSGAALAFYGALGLVLDFLFWFNEQMGIIPTPRISDWISFVLLLPLGFGISFQLPLVMLFLERVGILTIESYWKRWKVAVLVISILSMFLTPADPGSMILMGVPLVALYFGGILLCNYMPAHQKKGPSSPEESSGS